MIRVVLAGCVLVATLACERQAGEEPSPRPIDGPGQVDVGTAAGAIAPTVPPPEGSQPTAGAESSTGLMPPSPAGTEAGKAMTLPAGWTGVGVLQRRAQKLPRGVPSWAAIEAEVVEREGTRLLVASSIVADIANPALARTAAENRARAVLATWLGEQPLVGSEVVNAKWVARRKVAAVQVQVVVPESWAPGSP